jgi:hypothetical protein
MKTKWIQMDQMENTRVDDDRNEELRDRLLPHGKRKKKSDSNPNNSPAWWNVRVVPRHYFSGYFFCLEYSPISHVATGQ